MSEIQALWWTVQWVILPSITGAYALIIGFGWKLLRVCSGGRRDLWIALGAVKSNEVKHLQEQIDELKRNAQDDPSHRE